MNFVSNASGELVSPVSPADFTEMVKEIQTNPEVSDFSVDGNKGEATAQGVTFGFAYDGTNSVQIVIDKKTGMAKFASSNKIFSALNSKLIGA